MSGIESTTIDFNCSLAAGTVQITRDYELRVSRTGKRMGRGLARTDCSHKDSCGIASQDATGTTYDWSRCVFLHPPAP